MQDFQPQVYQNKVSGDWVQGSAIVSLLLKNVLSGFFSWEICDAGSLWSSMAFTPYLVIHSPGHGL